MYKVFFNEHQLVLGPEINNSSKDNIVQTVEIENVGNFFQLLSTLEKTKHVVKLINVRKEGADLPRLLLENIRQLPAAGGVVQNIEQQVLFIKRLGHWDLPTGKIEKGEDAQQAAIREVEEECGISKLKILRELPSTFHLYRSPFIKKENNWVLKETSWFEMSYSGNGHLMPQIEEAIEEVRWFNKSQLQPVLQNTYASLRELLNFYLA
jgi:8-oxo-dGTP pyrophosphatase MutT (NUDIX family)